MEVSLNEALDLMFEEEETSSSMGRMKTDIKKYEHFLDIIKGEKQFEGDINNPDDMKAVIKSIKGIHSELSGKGTGDESSLRKRLSRYLNKALEVEKIVNKIEAGDKITDKEEETFEKFADEIEDILFKETYIKQFFPDESGVPSREFYKIDGTFPLKYTTPKGKDYYAIVRPPTGVIAWENIVRDKKSSSNEIRSILNKDPEINLKSKFTENQYDKDNKKVYRNSIKDMLDTGRLKILDDNETKKKVLNFFYENGASEGSRSYIKGVDKAVGSIGFWKSIKNLF